MDGAEATFDEPQIARLATAYAARAGRALFASNSMAVRDVDRFGVADRAGKG